MPIPVTCAACGSRLKAPDALAGRKVKCPKCGDPVPVASPAITPAPTPPVPVARRRVVEPEEHVQPEPAADREEHRPRRRRKKRRPRVHEGPTVPTWAWWAGGVGACFAIALILLLTAVAGMKREATAYGLRLLIMLPISTLIFVVSMVISSQIAGGIKFGAPHIVIPKVLALLLVVNLLSLLPFGAYLTLLVWIFGLTLLFDIAPWEGRSLIVVNWILNVIVEVFLLAAILSPVEHALLGDEDETQPPFSPQQVQDLQRIATLGGTCDWDEGSLDLAVVRISLSHTRATDADLACLKDLPKLQTVELDSTAITDAGLAHLEELTSLQSLDLSRTAVSDTGLAHLKGLGRLQTLRLTGTRVTDAGVRDLQRSLPRLNIVR